MILLTLCKPSDHSLLCACSMPHVLYNPPNLVHNRNPEYPCRKRSLLTAGTEPPAGDKDKPEEDRKYMLSRQVRKHFHSLLSSKEEDTKKVGNNLKRYMQNYVPFRLTSSEVYEQGFKDVVVGAFGRAGKHAETDYPRARKLAKFFPLPATEALGIQSLLSYHVL